VSKFGTFAEYPPRSLASAEAALLTAWGSLQAHQDDLVLVGGLAVHYLTKRNLETLPGTVTLDVDFGITLGASGGQYGTIQSDLGGLGFVLENKRLIRTFGDITLYIDFLTEDPSAVSGGRQVDDIPASVVPGIGRALACRHSVNIIGRDLYGAQKSCHVLVADIGPLLVLKLNAFGGPTGRRHPKDAYDILLAVVGYIDGPEAAVAAFHAEAQAGNIAYPFALKALQNDFSELGQDGPTRAAEFYPGSQEERERVRQQVVTVSKILLGAFR
jgi:hypothetical protein